MEFINKYWPAIVAFLFFIVLLLNIFKKVNKNQVKLEIMSYFVIINFIITLIVVILNLFYLNFVTNNVINIAIILIFTYIFSLSYYIFNHLSKDEEQIKKLIQTNALLEKRLRDLENKDSNENNIKS